MLHAHIFKKLMRYNSIRYVCQNYNINLKINEIKFYIIKQQKEFDSNVLKLVPNKNYANME